MQTTVCRPRQLRADSAKEQEANADGWSCYDDRRHFLLHSHLLPRERRAGHQVHLHTCSLLVVS